MRKLHVVGALVLAVLGVCVGETRAGRGACLVGRHDWWVCEADVPGHDHRHCRRCGAER